MSCAPHILHLDVLRKKMNQRNQILEDKDFWLRLEYGMTLQAEKKEKIPRYWIDGFIPESSTNTRKGIEIEGKVWIFEGQKPSSCRFLAIIPQKLLNKKISEFEYGTIDFNPDDLFLKFEIKPLNNKQNKSVLTIQETVRPES